MKYNKPTYKRVFSTDDLLSNVAASLFDPTLPGNKLKRTATRTCKICDTAYKSDVSVLCDDGTCSEACQIESQRRDAEASVELHKYLSSME